MTPLAFFLKYSPEVVKLIAGIFKGKKARKEKKDAGKFAKTVLDKKPGENCDDINSHHYRR